MRHEGISLAAMGAWAGMMVMMMLPSLSPVSWRYHRALSANGVSRRGHQTLLFCAAYSGVWAALGVLLCALAAMGPPLPSTSVVTAMVLIGAGALQLTSWKARQLAHCVEPFASGDASDRNAVTACHDGVRLGIHCALSCAGHTATLVALGAMDPSAMVAVTAVITVERVLPAHQRIARAIGVLALCAGAILLEHAALANSSSLRW